MKSIWRQAFEFALDVEIISLFVADFRIFYEILMLLTKNNKWAFFEKI